MAYTVIKAFTDLQDNCHKYNVGDVFPREGVTVKSDRIAHLISNANRQGVPLIADNKSGLNSAIPVQSEKAGQEAPFMNRPEEPIIHEEEQRPKRAYRKKKIGN